MRQLFIFLFFTGISQILFSQQQTIDLSAVFKSNQFTAYKRTVSLVNDVEGSYLKLSEDKDQGIVWLPTIPFSTGKINVEMRGKDLIQKSFIGVAFHAKNDTTYDAVYCRPFNFHASDSVRRIHAVQYISMPTYTWKFLRENRNAEFENEIKDAPDPNGWFEMTLIIDAKTIQVFINNSKNPALIVPKLSSNIDGRIGLYVAENSGADFRKLQILNY